MNIYLMRHSLAAPSGPGVPDTGRFLTANGRERCRQVGRLLREAEICFDTIVCSPLVRAVQTAELIADAVDYLGVIESNMSFTPGGQPSVACKEIISRGPNVLMVGHEPSVSGIAAFLAGKPGFAPFRPGQVSFFDHRKPVWKLQPEALRFEDLHTP